MEYNEILKNATEQQVERLHALGHELMQIMQDVSGETMFELCGTSIGYAVSMVTMFAFNELGRRAVTKQSESETK